MQSQIIDLIKLGRLPREEEADPEILERVQVLLSEIARPITDAEAVGLAGLLGPDDCYGLAWTLIHIIEEAPGWPLNDVIAATDGEWPAVLTSRVREG